MEVFAWNSLFETGIGPVDEQHHKLVDLVNGLAARDMGALNGAQTLQDLTAALFEYARQHFTDEEQLMADYGLDSRFVSRHRREHTEFVLEVVRLSESHNAYSDANFDLLHRYLASWLSYHILGTDHAMSRQIERIRGGATPEMALAGEADCHGHGLAAMQEALHNLYIVIAEQNRQLSASNIQLEKMVDERTAALKASNANLLLEQQRLRERNIELAEMQNQLLQSEKMSAIGQLAAGVAHEINNPIGYVTSNLGTLKVYVERLLTVVDTYGDIEEMIPEGKVLARLHSQKQALELDYLRQDVVDLLQESSEGLGRVTKIVQNLKDFSHVDGASSSDADLHRCLDSTLGVVQGGAKYMAEIIKDYGDIPLVYCVTSQINQVFMNLIVNALHATEAGGTITLRTRHENGQVMIEVADTGQGIEIEVQKHIFEPFFTTKPVGKGTGLGLWLSYDIVKKHGGHIEVKSEPGQGASFKVWLPVEPEKNAK